MRYIALLLLFVTALAIRDTLPQQPTAVAPPPTAVAIVAQPAAPTQPVTEASRIDAPAHLHPAQPTTGGDYRRWGGELRYCWLGGWNDQDRAVMLSGMAAWEPAGVRFVPADSLRDCTLSLIAEYGGENGVGGYASMGPGMWGKLPGRITVNTFYPLSLWTATHEVGHVLGLLHWADGIMAEDGLTLAPGEVEFAAVRSMWGTP